MIEHYKGIVYLKPAEAEALADPTLAATQEANELLRPFMERGRAVDDDTIISRIWHDQALDAWDENDKYGLVRTFFGAGSDTTRTAMANGLHLLLSQPAVADKVRDAGARGGGQLRRGGPPTARDRPFPKSHRLARHPDR